MVYTKWHVLLSIVVLLVACGNDDLVMETSFDVPVDDVGEMSSSSSAKVKSSSDSKGNSSAQEVSSSCSESEPNSSANDTIAVVQIKDKTIFGVAQKGPFLAGSTVKLYELDQKTLSKTGKAFSGEVKPGNKGEFELPSVSLSGPYALVVVNGETRNELTGGNVAEKITLYALVNLGDYSKVNVNVLTHLAYERTLYLFETGVDIAAAKRQAESEVFKTVGFAGEFSSSERLNIFGDDNENAMLFALGVLMVCQNQSSRTEDMDKFVADFRKDGEWNDETVKAKKADWLQARDAENYFSTIRKNVENWQLGAVPNFKKYLRRFWNDVYGLGNCGDDEEGEVAFTQNKKSSTYDTETQFVCRDGSWSKLVEGDGTCGSCTKDREGVFCRRPNATQEWDICQNGKWRYAMAETVDTYGWTAGRDGEVRKGDSTYYHYKYDEVLKEWLIEWNYEDNGFVVSVLNGCTHKREGEVGWNPRDKTYYVCRHVNYFDVGIDVYTWERAQELDFIKRDEKCEKEDIGRIVAGMLNSTNKYYCSANGWADLMAWNFDVPKEFRFNPGIDYGTITDKRDGKKYRTVNIGKQVWMAENLNYAGDGIGHCYNDVPENCEVAGRLYKWDVAKDVCPEGWHLPSKNEFETLFSAVKLMYDKYDKAQYSFADMFKATSGWKNDNTNWTQGLDVVGFSAVPAGGKHIEAYRQPEYNHAGYAAYFLTSTDYDEHFVYIVRLSSTDVSLMYDFEEYDYLAYNTKEGGFPVRCLKDAE